VLFLGRMDEPRKGLAVLLEALPELAALVPDVRLLVAGPGDVDEVRAAVPPSLRSRVELLGLVSEQDKPRVFASGTVYCAPNTHGESFGIVLVEAMSAGTPVVASDLEAFRRVLDDGAYGVLVPVRDAGALAAALGALLVDAPRRAELAATARRAVRSYDWSTVTRQIVEVYETVASRERAAAPVAIDLSLEAAVTPDGDDEDDAGRLVPLLRRWISELPGRSTS
jgi:phosphatidylinositol alpha-mannosyltransferase